MAAVIHSLGERQDVNLLIMPARAPMDDAIVPAVCGLVGARPVFPDRL